MLTIWQTDDCTEELTKAENRFIWGCLFLFSLIDAAAVWWIVS